MIRNNPFKSLWSHTTAAAAVLWKRLPRIAIYALTFFVLFSIGDRLFYHYEPSSHFVQYTSFIVQNSLEGEDVPFTLCRDHSGDFEVSGIRTIYVVPAGKTTAQRVFVHNDRLNGVIAGSNCANYFIRNSDFHHPVGSYQMTIHIQFSVKYGEEKSVTIQSNVYRIRPNPNSQDTQIELNNLEAQVQALQAKLQSLGVQVNLPATQPATNQPSGENNTSPNNSSAGGTAPSSVSPVNQGAPSPTGSGTHQVCTINLLGIKLGCNDVPN